LKPATQNFFNCAQLNMGLIYGVMYTNVLHDASSYIKVNKANASRYLDVLQLSTEITSSVLFNMQSAVNIKCPCCMKSYTLLKLPGNCHSRF